MTPTEKTEQLSAEEWAETQYPRGYQFSEWVISKRGYEAGRRSMDSELAQRDERIRADLECICDNYLGAGYGPNIGEQIAEYFAKLKAAEGDKP